MSYNFVDFTFGDDDVEPNTFTAGQTSTASHQSTIPENDTAITENDTHKTNTPLENETSENETNNTGKDTITEAAVHIRDFDYDVEIFDWENFEQDIDFKGFEFEDFL